jgi:ethanolamine utilization cobalamin adenosyltransferase
MTREKWFEFIDKNDVTKCVSTFLKEEPSAEILFYLFKKHLVRAENLRNINKIPALRKLNEFRQVMQIQYFTSILSKIDVNKPDISKAIEILSDLSWDGLILLDIIPFNVFENFDFTKLSERGMIALMKLYKD